jgi:hypothetical protein
MDYKVEDHIYAFRVTRKGCHTYDVLSPEGESAMGYMFTELSPSIRGTVMGKLIDSHIAAFKSDELESSAENLKRSMEQVDDADEMEVCRRKNNFGVRSEQTWRSYRERSLCWRKLYAVYAFVMKHSHCLVVGVVRSTIDARLLCGLNVV